LATDELYGYTPVHVRITPDALRVMVTPNFPET
jgi:diacylglycerol kinase family enzyme